MLEASLVAGGGRPLDALPVLDPLAEVGKQRQRSVALALDSTCSAAGTSSVVGSWATRCTGLKAKDS